LLVSASPESVELARADYQRALELARRQGAKALEERAARSLAEQD
jgi:hypothetical protein